MNIGAIIAGFFAITFTAGALVLPFVMSKVTGFQPTALRRLGCALYALFGTMGLSVFAGISAMMLCAYIGIAGWTPLHILLGQSIFIGANLFFWFSRITRPSI